MNDPTRQRQVRETEHAQGGPGGRRRIRTAAEIRAAPEVCALCAGWSRGTSLHFEHERTGERVRLEMNLCTACGDRIEKHLKRAIPVRSMEVTRTEEAA